MPEILTVVAKMKAKKGKEEVLKKILLSLITSTRAEAGCVQYDFHQSIDEPGLFIFYENWRDEKALALHLASPHVQKALAETPNLLDGGLELYRMKKIN